MSSPSSSVVERQTFNLVVEGSIPSGGGFFLPFGREQSLTSAVLNIFNYLSTDLTLFYP